MERMEKKALREKAKARQKTLFEEKPKQNIDSRVIEEIKKIDPDKITLVDALSLLKRLKSLL
jgi:DNA mismatch repair ATPase MutS